MIGRLILALFAPGYPRIYTGRHRAKAIAARIGWPAHRAT